MKKLLFLLLILTPVICLGSTFKPNELKVNHYYYVLILKDDTFKKSFIERVCLVSKKNNIYIVRVNGWFTHYQQVKLDQILGEVKQ